MNNILTATEWQAVASCELMLFLFALRCDIRIKDGGNMAKEKSARRVGKTFKDIAPKDRRNSQMIRRLLYDTIAHEFGRDCQRASLALAVATQSNDMRAYDKPIQPETLYKAANDIHSITFQELNALAKYYKVPISAMLLYTRIRDELETEEKRGNGQALDVILSVKHLIVHLEHQITLAMNTDRDIFDLFGHQNFKQYVASYHTSLEPIDDQPELPLS